MQQFSTLIELLRDRAQRQSEQTGYIFLADSETESGHLTYAQLDDRARAIAVALQEKVPPGSRALLLYPFSDGLEFVPAFFGCLYAGIVAVTTYPPRPNQSLEGFEARVTSSETTIALTTQALLDLIRGNLPKDSPLASIHWIATDTLSTDTARQWHPPEVGADTLAFLQYTSGSTGTPKGVMVTHRNILHNSEAIYRGFDHNGDSRGVIWLPQYHDMGLIGGVIQPVYGGFPVVLMSPMTFLQKPFHWLQAISRYRATTSGGPNFAYDLCIRSVTEEQKQQLDLSCWQVAFSGAEPVRAETLGRFTEAFAECGFRREAFYPCYGMAETTLLASGGLKSEAPIVRYVDGAALDERRVVPTDPSNPQGRAVVGCGRTWLGQEIAIVDPDTLQRCDRDRVGEIWVAGDGVGRGYWNQPEQSDRTFNAYLADTGEGPFLRTGDFGFLDDGELFVTGRLKNMMIVWGRNHYPQNIELTMQQSHPVLRLNGGAAFSLDRGGEDHLVVINEVERTALRRLDPEEVIGAIRIAILKQHEIQPSAVVLVKPGSTPKTSSGKVQRHVCRDRFLAGTLPVVAEWQDFEADRTEILQWLARSNS
ncbi:fatty acyl-AMP ligase [Oxynema sp. CENA135]|uniref:fatty acyl-AMP ligase n=1 Tax=Oxynema sp. CENA135 TaxID=984206 RepID=UPI00190DB83B|nr:fatty acyl-AMP ligase [Oxynema sp. CENA135]MBK4731660.1 fatty acyl-AMP ligase [Oxynema sp. CENA135]